MKADVTTTKIYRRDGVKVARVERNGTTSFELTLAGFERPNPEWDGTNRSFTVTKDTAVKTPSQLEAIVEVIQAALKGES